MQTTETFFTQDVINELADAVQKNIQNAGVIGISRDFSKAVPQLGELGLTSPMVASLLEAVNESAIGDFTKNEKGEWVVSSYSWGTTDPDDGEGCCFVPFDLQAGKEQAKIFKLCLKDCETTLDKMMNKQLGFKGTDLVNYFQRLGWTYDQSLKFLAWYSFAFRTQRVIAQGLTTLQNVPGLRPFHGVAEVMAHNAVTPIKSADILAAFAQAGAVLDILNQSAKGDYKIFVHPLGHIAIEEKITPGINGQLPAGWERGDFGSYQGVPVTLKFHGVPVVKDIYVPKDQKTGTFEAYIIDTATTKASMVYKDLMIPEDAIRTGQTLDPDTNCDFVECDIYENAGVVHSANYARNILVAGMQLSGNTPANIFTRIQSVLDGEVPFPMAAIPGA